MSAPVEEEALAPLDPELPIRHVTSTRVITVRGDELEIRDDLVVGRSPSRSVPPGRARNPSRSR
jgi:hypothetical protein